jgi:hypothetical protein
MLARMTPDGEIRQSSVKLAAHFISK